MVEADGVGREDEQADEAAGDPGQAILLVRQPHRFDEALFRGVQAEVGRR